MPISFFDLLADEGWEPLDFFQGDPTFYWNDGGFIANAPVDIAATLDGAIWRSTNVEPAFRWQGRRIRPDFTVPKRHVNHPQLMIVVGGQLTVEYGANGEETRQLGPGEFWTGDAKVPFTITSGPDGRDLPRMLGPAAAGPHRDHLVRRRPLEAPRIRVEEVPPALTTSR